MNDKPLIINTTDLQVQAMMLNDEHGTKRTTSESKTPEVKIDSNNSLEEVLDVEELN